MPEHRAGTPAEYRELESFLWHDFEDAAAGWAAWLRHRAAWHADPAATLAAAIRLHAALRTLEAANGGAGGDADAEAREALNGLVAARDLRPQVEPAGGVRLVAGDDGDPVAMLLRQALEAMQAGDWRRFKLCREPSCRASFYDASRPAAKLWCEMTTCGSRNKMRRYRAKD